MTSASIRRLALICFLLAVVWLVATLLDRETTTGGPVVLESSPFGTDPSPTWRTSMEIYTHTIRSAGGTTVETKPHVRVQLRDESGNAVWGGAVAVNGVKIDSHHVLDNVFYEVRQWAAAVPLRFDGSYHTFTVAGSGDFPALTDSIRSLTGKTAVTHPMPTDTVPGSKDLVIRWNTLGGAEQVKVWVRDSSTGSIEKSFKGDPGSCSLTADELRGLRPGPLTVAVGRARMHEGKVNGRTYQMTIGSVEDIHTTLIPGRQ